MKDNFLIVVTDTLDYRRIMRMPWAEHLSKEKVISEMDAKRHKTELNIV